MLLLHGFPQFWWTWRGQLVSLAEAGYRAVAMDLRGYGASDKPPRGYDPLTLAADAAGVIRALGARDAVVVGHGTGGLVAWTTAAVHTSLVRGLAVLSTPHPGTWRSLFGLPRGRLRRQVLGWRPPILAERGLLHADAAPMVSFLRRGYARGWSDPVAERRYRDAFQVPGVARRALATHRWMARSPLRTEGRRYRARMRRPIRVPTLRLHGSLDRVVPAAAVESAHRHAHAPWTLRFVAGAGHFPHEEQPDAVGGILVDWLQRTVDSMLTPR
ncbi:alpha/beta fold hydrolase [Spiractinospora alimapuensis]|uniref:alpha/beta fold hydrolase n=1 Tax=Spiractinospora alimapuensis TaxID=2820884 RepID=UPI002ED549A1